MSGTASEEGAGMAEGAPVTLARAPVIGRWWWPQRKLHLWTALLRHHLAQVSGRATVHSTTSPASALRADCELFIRLHERQILNYLWRMTGDEHDAYDLTQEVFLRAWQHFDTIRQYEQPRGWLFRVATNLALTHIRRRALLAGGLSWPDSEHDPASSDPAGRLAERDLVRQTLLQLSPKRRAALVLREVYGLTAAEAGQVLGMTETAIRMALHRAREQFRDVYRREGGVDDGQ